VNLAESETVIYPALESLKIKEFEFALISHFDEDHFSYLTNGSYGQMRHANKNGNLPEKYKVKKVITRDASQDFAHYSSQDYDEAWRSMRVSSYTDLILMKIYRTKQIESLAGNTLVSEGIDANYMDMINYSVFGLIKIEFEG
jgi:Cft2 family RNA processing exonuclease